LILKKLSTITHDYFFQILDNYGFSMHFQRCIRSMYRDATSSIHINGHMTGRIPINCSVRQGCPLRMLLFAICIVSFLRALASNLTGISVGSSGTHSAVLAYALDVTILLQSTSDIPKIQTILGQYGAVSGAKINIWKSKALAVGRWDTTENVLGIQYHEGVKIPGLHFTTTINHSGLRSWSAVTDGIRAQAREAYNKELNLNNCILYVHNYMLARAWFTAQVFPLPRFCERQINTAIVWFIRRGRHFPCTIINPPTAERAGRVGLTSCHREMPSPVAPPPTVAKRDHGTLTAAWFREWNI
jgi:hypothetical protein